MYGLESTLHRCGARVCARALGILGVAALAACASPAGREHAPSPITGRVVVHNHTGTDFVLYLARPGRVAHLGAVGARADADLPVPAQAHPGAGEFWLIAWQVGGPLFSSESFPFPQGVIAEWTIGIPAASTYAVLPESEAHRR